MSSDIYPKISIVTVSYNAVSTIEETILSVINQTYHNIEYIIIDGGSTDGTVDIIEKYADKIGYWISEPDEGIFAAMNKGVEKATGDWIGFINSGDNYFSYDSICEIFVRNKFDESISILYGNMLLKYSFALFLSRPLSLQCFHKQFPFSHPACFVKAQLLKQNPFNRSYKLAADYDFFLKLYKQKMSFLYVDTIISVFEAEEGVSSKNRLKTYKEVSTINGYNNYIKYNLSYYSLAIKSKLLDSVKYISPHFYEKIILNRLLCNNNISLFQ